MLKRCLCQLFNLSSFHQNVLLFIWSRQLRIVPHEINVSTLLYGLCQQITRIEWFVLFQHGPGNHQHLGGDLDAGLGPDPTLFLAAFQHPVVDAAEGIVVIRGDLGGLIQP